MASSISSIDSNASEPHLTTSAGSAGGTLHTIPTTIASNRPSDVRLAELGAVSNSVLRSLQQNSPFGSRVPRELHDHIGGYLDSTDLVAVASTCQHLRPIYGELYKRRLLARINEIVLLTSVNVTQMLREVLEEIESNISPEALPEVLDALGRQVNMIKGWDTDVEDKYWSLLSISPAHPLTAMAAARFQLTHIKHYRERWIRFLTEKLDVYDRLIEKNAIPTGDNAIFIISAIANDAKDKPFGLSGEMKKNVNERTTLTLHKLTSQLATRIDV